MLSSADPTAVCAHDEVITGHGLATTLDSSSNNTKDWTYETSQAFSAYDAQFKERLLIFHIYIYISI